MPLSGVLSILVQEMQQKHNETELNEKMGE
jgi:hypothetical protein